MTDVVVVRVSSESGSSTISVRLPKRRQHDDDAEEHVLDAAEARRHAAGPAAARSEARPARAACRAGRSSRTRRGRARGSRHDRDDGRARARGSHSRAASIVAKAASGSKRKKTSARGCGSSRCSPAKSRYTKRTKRGDLDGAARPAGGSSSRPLSGAPSQPRVSRCRWSSRSGPRPSAPPLLRVVVSKSPAALGLASWYSHICGRCLPTSRALRSRLDPGAARRLASAALGGAREGHQREAGARPARTRRCDRGRRLREATASSLAGRRGRRTIREPEDLPPECADRRACVVNGAAAARAVASNTGGPGPTRVSARAFVVVGSGRR